MPLVVAGFLVAALLPLAAAARLVSSSGDISIEVGAAFAILATTLLFLQFLSSGRFEAFSGRIGIDRTMGFHRNAALVLLVLALAHPLSYVARQAFTEPAAAVLHLQSMLASGRLRSGLIALGLLVVLVVFASVRTRRFVRYEVWRIAHGPMAIAAGTLALHHALLVGTYSANVSLRAVWAAYALAALGAALIGYGVRPWRMWRQHWRVESTTLVADGVTEVILAGPAAVDFPFRGGQFIWITVAPHRPPFHDHPFSVASSANFLPRLRLLVRHAGDCTSEMGSIPPGTPVAIDGPHGSFTLPDDTSAIVLIAGGVGIAPILGILEEAAERVDCRRFRLLYTARRWSGLAATRELDRLRDRIDLSIAYVVDEGQTTGRPGPFGALHLKELAEGLPIEDTSVLVCGPPGMIELAADVMLGLGFPASHIHYERFDYGAGHGRMDRARRRDSLAILTVVVAAGIAFGLRAP